MPQSQVREFLAIDGDDVGNLLRNQIITNNIEGMSSLSKAIIEYFFLLRDILEKKGYETVFCAGDSLLSVINQSIVDNIFAELPVGPCFISGGIGATPEYAYLALQLAKARGKNQIVRIEGATVNTIYRWNKNDKVRERL